MKITNRSEEEITVIIILYDPLQFIYHPSVSHITTQARIIFPMALKEFQDYSHLCQADSTNGQNS